MIASLAFFAGCLLLFVGLVYVGWRRSGYHRAKAEVYQEFADTFSSMVPMHRIKDKTARRRASKRGHMRLALIDPHIRDGLRDALADADEHWAALDQASAAIDRLAAAKSARDSLPAV